MAPFQYVWDDDPACRIILRIEHEDGEYHGAKVEQMTLIDDDGEAWHTFGFMPPTAGGPGSLADAAVRLFERRVDWERRREICEAHQADRVAGRAGRTGSGAQGAAAASGQGEEVATVSALDSGPDRRYGTGGIQI